MPRHRALPAAGKRKTPSVGEDSAEGAIRLQVATFSNDKRRAGKSPVCPRADRDDRDQSARDRAAETLVTVKRELYASLTLSPRVGEALSEQESLEGSMEFLVKRELYKSLTETLSEQESVEGLTRRPQRNRRRRTATLPPSLLRQMVANERGSETSSVSTAAVCE